MINQPLPPRPERAYNPRLTPPVLISAAAPFCIGVFHVWASALLSIVILICLVYQSRRQPLRLPSHIGFWAAVVTVAAYALCSLWAVDKALAPFGAVKYLPVPLFFLLCANRPGEEARTARSLLPYLSAASVVLSLLLGCIPGLQGLFYVNSRLAGFFQYPNTFALYLLLGLIVGLQSEASAACKYPVAALNLSGILLSGSRTVFFLLAGYTLVLIIIGQGKVRFVPAFVLAGLALAAACYAAGTGNVSSVTRFLTASRSASTLLGRLLYVQDALPVILKHPFGLGYMGYSFLQGSFQTGVYSVANAHNELAQLLLDVGWLPAGITIAAFIQIFRETDLEGKILLACLCIHSLFDFDFQYIAIALLPVLLAEHAFDAPAAPKRVRAKHRKSQGAPRQTGRLPGSSVAAAAAVLIAGSMYFGAVSGAEYCKDYTAVLTLYPNHTYALMEKLKAAGSAEEVSVLSERILARNKSVSLAWSAKARVAYARGDFTTVISAKTEAISLSPYTLEEYLDFFDMLYKGYELYTENNMADSAEFCRQCLLSIPSLLEDTLIHTSSLGRRIADQPNLILPAEYQTILSEIS